MEWRQAWQGRVLGAEMNCDTGTTSSRVTSAASACDFRDSHPADPFKLGLSRTMARHLLPVPPLLYNPEACHPGCAIPAVCCIDSIRSFVSFSF